MLSKTYRYSLYLDDQVAVLGIGNVAGGADVTHDFRVTLLAFLLLGK